MNLHEMVRGDIGMVNPNVMGYVHKSKGYALAGAGNRTPLYFDPQEIELQVQSATGRELQHLEYSNIQGEVKSVVAPTQLYGIDEDRGYGGDLLEFYGRVWLVQQRVEAWEASGWCRVLVTAQLDKPQEDEEVIEDYDFRE